MEMISQLNAEFRDVNYCCLWFGLNTVLPLAALFWAYLLYDTLGYVVGAVNAVWILLVMFTAPWWLKWTEQGMLMAYHNTKNDDNSLNNDGDQNTNTCRSTIMMVDTVLKKRTPDVDEEEPQQA